jgi:ABC-type cobalamin/Fe3+-siderophores transport system ATPase subunit
VREVLTKARIESVYRIEVEIASIGDADKPLILPCW